MRASLAATLLLLAVAPAVAIAQLLTPGPLTSAHRSLDGDSNCTKCHESGRRIAAARCNDCHQDIAATIRNGTGLHGRRYRGQECAKCHVEHRGRGGQLIRWPKGNPKNFDHSETGYSLNGAHRQVACKECHEGRNKRGVATYLGTDRRCKSCHEDEHEGRFGDRCESCHSETRWSAVKLDRFDHSQARFALRGAHEKVKCIECHGAPAKWKGIKFERCTDCHNDPHEGRFGDRCEQCHTDKGFDDLRGMRANHPGLRLGGGHRRVGCARCHGKDLGSKPARGSRCVACHAPVHEADFGRACEPCHRAIEWAPLPRDIGLEAHDKTPFALEGRHTQVECTSCHQPKLRPQQRYRELRFGRCVDCHSDSHRGEFANRQGGECAQCHDEQGFSPTLFGIQAHASTAFELRGRHQAVPCGACHKSDRPRLDWRLDANRCNDCHETPHGDQFATEMTSGGCAHCHTVNGWDRPNIDHRTWPLLGAHARTACVSCHQPTPEDRKTGRGASYRGLSRDCAGCHASPHGGQFRLSEPRRECDACHGNESFEIEPFDHASLASYPLEGKHAALQCERCHATTKLSRGETVIRYRLGYRECRDCHADPHEGAGR